MKMRRLPEIHNQKLMPFRWRELEGGVLVTNDAGEFVWLEREEFGDLLAGTLAEDSPVGRKLEQRHLLRAPRTESELIEKVRRRNTHLESGPNLHIVILTLRCNQNCVYCHASRKPLDSDGFDMSKETAGRVLDVIFAGPSRDLTIEFQGGEPTLNFDVLRFFVEEAYRRNADGARNLYFSLVSNLPGTDRL